MWFEIRNSIWSTQEGYWLRNICESLHSHQSKVNEHLWIWRLIKSVYLVWLTSGNEFSKWYSSFICVYVGEWIILNMYDDCDTNWKYLSRWKTETLPICYLNRLEFYWMTLNTNKWKYMHNQCWFEIECHQCFCYINRNPFLLA